MQDFSKNNEWYEKLKGKVYMELLIDSFTFQNVLRFLTFLKNKAPPFQLFYTQLTNIH